MSPFTPSITTHDMLKALGIGVGQPLKAALLQVAKG